MTKTLYLMRHGETLFNLMQLAQGWCDSPLTNRGIEQARRAAACMRDWGFEFDHFSTSTQERAIDTLEIIMRELYGEIRPYDRLKGLKESLYGQYEASPLPIVHAAFRHDQDTFVPFGGEPYTALQDRMLATLTSLMEQPDTTSALVISHMRSSLAFLKRVNNGRDIVGHLYTNCGIMRFDYDSETGFTYREIYQTGGLDVDGNEVA